MTDRVKLALASASPRRLSLLEQAGIVPELLRPAEIDETPLKSESPRNLATRLAKEKALAVHAILKAEGIAKEYLVLGADTVVGQSRRVLPKAESMDQAISCLRLLSGRTHKVWTSVCLITPNGKARQRLVETRLRFKRLAREDIEGYVASGEWRGKAGGYAVQGIAGSFVIKLVGSYTNVVGLPLYETLNLLAGEGYAIRAGWASVRS